MIAETVKDRLAAMERATFSELEHDSKNRRTRRAIFLERMDRLIPECLINLARRLFRVPQVLHEVRHRSQGAPDAR